MGESAGAMAAMLHLVAPPSAGLFHRVVALSGAPSNPLLSQSRKPAVYAKALATRLGCNENADNQTILQFLQGVKATKILSNALMFLDWDFGNPLPWVPVDDSDLNEPFLPLDFRKAVKAGKVARVPVMMGCCRDEGLILSGPFHRDQKRLELLTRWARWMQLTSCYLSPIREWECWAPLLFLGRERGEVSQEENQLARLQDFKGFNFTFFCDPLFHSEKSEKRTGHPLIERPQERTIWHV